MGLGRSARQTKPPLREGKPEGTSPFCTGGRLGSENHGMQPRSCVSAVVEVGEVIEWGSHYFWQGESTLPLIRKPTMEEIAAFEEKKGVDGRSGGCHAD